MSDDGAPDTGPDNDGTKPDQGTEGTGTGGSGPNGPGTDDDPDKGNTESGKGDAGKAAEPTAEEKLAEATKNSRKWEDRSKAHAEKVKAADAKATAAEDRLKAVLKAAGMDEDEEDPTEAVKRATSERDAAVAKAAAIEAERTAEKAARALGADVDKILDSRAVERDLAALEDPTDADAVKAVLTEALENYPHLKAPEKSERKPSGSVPIKGGGEGGKGSGPMSIEDHRKARGDRRRY